MESKVHQINWFQRGKYGLYFWNQYRILIYSNLQKSPPEFGKLRYRPVNAQNFSLEGDFVHLEYHWFTQCRLLLLPKIKSNFGSISAFSKNFLSASGSGSDKKRRIRMETNVARAGTKVSFNE